MFNIFNIFVWIKKSFSKKDFLLLILLIFIYLLTRLYNLDQFPIFSDEGIYIRWAKVAWHDASWRFISLTDGKQPLQTWGTIPFLKLFPDNALLAGRLFSVITGFAALIGMFTLLFYLFNKKTAFVGGFICVFTPYFLFYDRMALVDSAVNAGFIWILFFSILLVKTVRLDIALIFGLVAGFSLLAKSSVRIFFALSVLAPLLQLEKSIKKTIPKIINYYLLFIISSILALVVYNVQRLSPFFHYVAQKNATFVMTMDEFLQNPFMSFFHNIKIIPEYVINESGFILFFFAILGLWKLLKAELKLSLYLASWILFPFLAIAFFSKVIFPRYLIFFGSILVVFASYFFTTLNNRYQTVCYLLLATFFIYYNYTIFFDYPKIPFPEIDRGQYVEGATVGIGAREIVEFAREISDDKEVVLLAEGNFGLVGDVLDVFTKPGDKIFIKGFWPLDKKALLENQKELDEKFVYAVFAQRKDFPSEWPLRLIKKFDKPGKKSTIYLFELTK
ncbi:hypothetical protein A2774_04345 [Candidatus Roizmanbacteria bacterium RIFCSPHIGHO2_01_FULL_39_12c]|uniref:Glycosyltransferase RgtA/B/C/D-like domain-containing protein n=1 Tax=Candidatus Roizmanbacteria bacterium RIFCSPHIGHO2_01_FULL_39_12c TaxID=1802031 RepID=A0A1F7G9H4_9BACT|nr:MAG: hypothetical protein A2774_04345 [Candidatus Roizmanbacteria bacterium RIFCSPHIGHO2_01_FULL_39_12c]OGK47800.1 MAG: hypothetical protein A2963_03025 [Candidatus Roizmanbacteria bacterium RIFCSPLOWO2_01_FULL_40_13]